MKIFTCGEDLLFSLDMYLKASNVFFLTDCFYHYIENIESATNAKDKYLRNCDEYINNYWLTLDIIEKYQKMDEVDKKRLATSRFRHLIHYYFSRMIKAHMINEIVQFCSNENLLKFCSCVSVKNLELFDKLMHSAIIKNRKIMIKLLLRIKAVVMKILER